MPNSNEVRSENVGSDADRAKRRVPPKSGQFKKGVSGNPGGRPKRRVTQLDQVIIDTLEAVSGDRTVLEIFIQKFVREALQSGNVKAAKLIMEWYAAAKSRQSRSNTESDQEEQAARRFLGEHFSIFDEASSERGTESSDDAADEDD